MQALRSYLFSNSPVKWRFTNVVLPERDTSASQTRQVRYPCFSSMSSDSSENRYEILIASPLTEIKRSALVLQRVTSYISDCPEHLQATTGANLGTAISYTSNLSLFQVCMQVSLRDKQVLICTCATITDDDQLKGRTVVRSDLPRECLREKSMLARKFVK